MNDNNLDPFFFLIRILTLFVVPLFIISVGAYLLFNFFRNRKRRLRDFQNFAAETGLTYVGADSLHSIPGHSYFRLFNLENGSGRRIENAVKGTIDVFHVFVFNYAYYLALNNRRVRHQTVVMMASPRINLPVFSLYPEGKGLLQRLGSALDPDINFPANPSFSGKYRLFGRSEAHVRQLFDDRVLSYFDASGINNSGLIVEGGGNLVFLDETVAAPDRLPWMLNEGLKIAGLFAR